MAVKLKVKTFGNLDTLINVISYIESREFNDDLKSFFERERSLLNIRTIVQSVIENEVYKYGTEEGRIKRSFKVIAVEDDKPKIVVISVPMIAPSVGPFKSGDPNDFSYAAFFEKPIEFDSFIDRENDNKYAKSRFRPFMDIMARVVKDYVTEDALHAATFKLRQKLPRK